MGVAAAIAGAAVIGGVATNVAQNKASKAQGKATDRSIAATQQGTAEARADINRIFPQAQETANVGFQGALDVFGQSVPAQFDVFQQGNVAAQQALISGLPQIQNAILGGNIDFSALQPFQAQNLPTGIFQQQTPMNIQAAQQAELQAQQDAANMGPAIQPNINNQILGGSSFAVPRGGRNTPRQQFNQR